MCGLWIGDISYKRAIAEGKLELVGLPALTCKVESWLASNKPAGIASARAIVEPT